MTKLNLGCGNKKIDGYINIDGSEYCKPDLVLNLENTPYPFKSNTIDEIRLKSVIEHFPLDPNNFFRIIKELYRICTNGAKLFVECPHPNHRWQVVDMTHQKPIHYEGLQMLDQDFCNRLIKMGSTRSPLAIMYEVNFKINSYEIIIDPEAKKHIENVLGTYDKNKLDSYVHLFNDIVATQRFELQAIKE